MLATTTTTTALFSVELQIVDEPTEMPSWYPFIEPTTPPTASPTYVATRQLTQPPTVSYWNRIKHVPQMYSIFYSIILYSVGFTNTATDSVSVAVAE